MTTTFPLSRQEIEMKLMKLPIQAPRMNELDKHNGMIKINNKKDKQKINIESGMGIKI